MPIYLYRCEGCGGSHEALQKASDPLLTRCPHCDQEALRKVIAPAGVIFRGSGFHKNDYSSTGRKSGGSSSSASSSSPDAGPAKASEGGGSAPASTSSPGDGSGGGKGESKGADKVA